MIELPNGVEISLKHGETQILQQSKFTIEDYFSFFDEKKRNNIPLFRTIKHKDYLLFVGLPYNETIASITKNNRIKSSYNLKNIDTDSKNYTFKHYEKEGQQLIEFCTKVDNTIIYMLGVTSKEDILSNYLSLQQLSKRITKE